LQADCKAFKLGQTSAFPVKKKKNPLKHRHFHFGVFSNRTHIALIRRKTGDIWAGLHTPWLIEGDEKLPAWPDNRAFSGKQVQPEMIQQVLSHQKIFGYFYSFSDPGKVFLQEHELLWVPKKSLSELAFPRMVLVFLKNSGYL
jgi:adenine-specific DNA glycosylase